MATITLEVVTPEGKLYEGEVSMVKIPGTGGSFAVLPRHAPLISTLSKGLLEITETNGNKYPFTIQGGVVEVTPTKVIVLVEKLLTGEAQKKDE